MIAGPCSFGTYEELDSITKKLKELNVDILRAGTFKGRTSICFFSFGLLVPLFIR